MKSGGILKGHSEKIGGSPSAGLTLALFALLLLSPTLVRARVSTQVNEICAKTTDAAYRAKYCSAAKDLKHGHNANVATSAVWSGVSVACGMACGKTYTGSGVACKIAGYGGTAGEGVITKKFTDALVGEGMKWGGQALTGKEATTTAATDGAAGGIGEKVNGDACAAAGKSALKAYEKFSNSKENEKSLVQLREETKGMNTPVAKNQLSYSAGIDSAGDPNGPNGSAATASDETCGDSAIGTALGAIRCAASADRSLPPYVKSEEFLKDLQKATGKSPDAFFGAFESPAKAIFDSPIVSGMPDGQQNKLAESLSAMEGYSDMKARKLASATAAPAEGYSARGGKGSASGDDDTGFDMNGMIAGVLGQMGGEADGENGAAANAGGIAVLDRRPAENVEAAEDPKVSLFDRVQWRYGSVSARDRLGVQ